MAADWKERMEGLRLQSLKELFGVEKPIIGMVHLWPLPGAPGYTGYGMDQVIDRALEDARTLVRGGVDGLMVENMWDLPYYVGRDVPPEEMTAQAVAARAVVEEAKVPVGINVVHNGGVVTLAIAVAAGARFIRVCLLTGAQVWDTGELDHGCAADLLRKRKELYAEEIKIFADVDKKHSVRFPGIDLATHIEWTEFYGADAIIVSGKMTGAAPDMEKVRLASELATRPVLLGSGTNEENIADFLLYADGAIVGSSLKRDGDPTNPVDLERVKRYMEAVRRVRGE
ncbi:MAG: Photosystem I assembly BtpA [Acetothermia bacterium 64_32]|nr:MAG: Photosystem I assembly BtpA [Acetothermia bacterium 64_32]HAF71113.1 photosystem I assembly BtpA [Candidatus Acetothermia bacterium]